jgi:hypothetical protein
MSEIKPISPIINKPVEPARRFIETVSTPASIDHSTPTESPKATCEFRGTVRNPSTGESFVASSEIHQNHSKYYTCLNVIFMERASGRHGENCAFVGHLSATKCCVKDKDKS